MKLSRLTFAFFFSTLFTTLAFAAEDKTIRGEVRISTFTDGEDIDQSSLKKKGWKVEKDKFDETVYVFTLNHKLSALPLEQDVGDAYFSISKAGLITIGASIGDSDASAKTSLQLPVEKKQILELKNLLALTVSGGDHAGGAWSVDGSIKLTIKN